MDQSTENAEQKISPQAVLAGIVDGSSVKSHTRDGETATDYSAYEKIAALKEIQRVESGKVNPFSCIRKVGVPLNSMQE